MSSMKCKKVNLENKFDIVTEWEPTIETTGKTSVNQSLGLE